MQTLRLSIGLMAAVLAVASCARRSEAPSPAQASPAGGGAPAAATIPSAAPPAAGGPVELGSAFPAYSVPSLDGGRFDLSAERGNVVMLNLWATWCGPCRQEIPDLQALHDRYAARRFKVVGVSLDEESADVVRKFAAEHRMTYPIALDPEGRASVILETSVLPTTVLVDREGRVVWKKYGVVDTKDAGLNAVLEKALGQR